MTAGQKWAYGAVAALVNGGASAVALIMLDPMTFNLETGWRKLLTGTIVFALFGVANYLKSHPLPEWETRKDVWSEPERMAKRAALEAEDRERETR